MTFLCFIGSILFEILPVFLPADKSGMFGTVSNRLWWAFSLLMTTCVSYAFGMSLKWPSLRRGMGEVLPCEDSPETTFDEQGGY
jgi:hypothetical protein